MHRDVYVLIPAYNEAPVIRDVLTEVTAVFPNVVCINDGSADDTAAEIEKTPAVLINHPFNMGQGAALQTGIDYALQDPEAKYFVTFDSDGQHRLEDVVTMLPFVETGGYDIALGSRFSGEAENISLLKLLVLKAAVRFSNLTAGVRLTDAHNGIRVFNRPFAENLRITIPNMAHATEIIHQISDGGYRYVEVPVTVKYTDYSRAKGQSVFNAVNIAFDVLMNRMTKR